MQPMHIHENPYKKATFRFDGSGGEYATHANLPFHHTFWQSLQLSSVCPKLYLPNIYVLDEDSQSIGISHQHPTCQQPRKGRRNLTFVDQPLGAIALLRRS